MTLRDQIQTSIYAQIQGVNYEADERPEASPLASQHSRELADEIVALLSEGPTPTQIEAGRQAIYRECRDPKYRYAQFPLITHAESACLAEAVLRAASEATP